jgi:glycosyltransferase involved in cell wall biosynthesis
MQPVALVQPPPRGRISGGFLYNTRMAEHGSWELLDVPSDELNDLAQRLVERRPVLMDSLWLAEGHVEAFVALSARGWPVGVMLHSFPSMIAAADSGREPPTQPSGFEVSALERLGLVVVPGRHYADMLAGCKAKIVIAEPGIDVGWRAEPRQRQGACRLVSVGAATPRKGFLDVAEILNVRKQRGTADFEWTVVGSLDADIEYAKCLVERTRSLATVVLEGQRPPRDVQRIVRASDVLVMPSYDENQPLVLVEAMAASVPAVAYAAGAARHMLEHEREGLIAPIGDKQCLSDHLNRLLDDEGVRHAMAVACWKRQTSIPTWSAAARLAQAALRTAWATLGA